MKRYAIPTRRIAAGLALLLLTSCAQFPGAPGFARPRHPFLLWTPQEAAAIRRRIETDDLARRQYERMQFMESKQVRQAIFKSDPNPVMLNLFKYAVLGDRRAGETEKQQLLRFVRARPPRNRPGNPATSNASWRDDRTLDALRYDVLYDELSPEQREGVERNIRAYVDWFLENPGPLAKPGRSRMGWLPNMQWPTAAGVHVLAVVSRDKRLIRKVFNATGGWKWYFDNYVADGRFYMEEFGKYYSNIGSMLFWCEGLERLGLSRYGYGYTSPEGANMRNHLEMLIWAGYPRMQQGDRMPDYPTVHMGDAGSLPLVTGRNADGSGGDKWWRKSNMNGPIPKMYQPLWWEIGHRRFPDSGFDYFLAQMRAPGEEVYLPSLYFGLGPVDPRKVTPPPVHSYVTRGRGFAMLRAEESRAYWESPKPAVSLQFGMYYMHNVHDCLCLLQYVADNRFVYNRFGALQRGYAGKDPWRDSVRGQASGVTVDSLQVRFVDSGEEGCKHQRIRSRFSPTAKFAAVRVSPRFETRTNRDGTVVTNEVALYPGVDAERALVLTDAYLFDVYRLTGGRQRVYDWHVQGSGRVAASDAAPWTDSDELGGGGFWSPQLTTQRNRKVPDPQGVRRKPAGTAAWTETLLQGEDDRGAFGVRVRMLDDGPTALFCFPPPRFPADLAAVLMARRTATNTVFAALHEPFTGGTESRRVGAFTRLAQNERGLAAAVTGVDGSEINDRILLAYGDDIEQPLTLAGGDESFTFSDCVHVRIGRDRVTVTGPIQAMDIPVSGTPVLMLDGEKAGDAVVEGGRLQWQRRP